MTSFAAASVRFSLASLVALVPLAVASCDDGDDGGDSTPGADAGPANPLAPPAPGEGVQFAFDTVAPAQTEIWKCLVGPIPGQDGGGFLNFSGAISKQSPGVHHMDLAILTKTTIEPGLYDCQDLYDAHETLMDEVIIYASQQADQQLMLPEGTVARIPRAVNTLLEIHFVNTSDQEQEVFTRVNAYTVEDGEWSKEIYGGAIRDRTLNIPAGGTADEWTRCEFNQDAEVLVLSTHTHALASKTEVFKWNGVSQAVGELIYENDDWHAPPLLDLTASPLQVKAGEGFEFHCKYENPTASDVHWGFSAAEEMCNLALVYTPGSAVIQCEKVETSDGVLNP